MTEPTARYRTRALVLTGVLVAVLGVIVARLGAVDCGVGDFRAWLRRAAERMRKGAG